MKQIKFLFNLDSAPGSSEVDPLSGASSGWEAPKFPVLAANQVVRLEFIKASYGPVKEEAQLPPEQQKRFLLTLETKTLKDYMDTEGKVLRAGFKSFIRVGMTPTEGTDTKRARTWKNIGEDLGMIHKACGTEFSSKHEPKEFRDNPAHIIGQVADARTTVQPEKDGFPASNGFKFIPPA